MPTTPLVAIGSDELIKNRLKRDFPGWRFLKSDRGRWWAFRGPLPADRMDEVDTVEANTPDGLHAQLKDVIAKAASMNGVQKRKEALRLDQTDIGPCC